MKKITTSIIVALTLAACACAAEKTDQNKEKARNFYQMGIIALKEGNLDFAKTSFTQVLKIYPNHSQARRKILYITSNSNVLKIKKRKAKLHKVIIPNVILDKATIQESLEMLAAQISNVTAKKYVPNIIVQDPTEGFKGHTVTLQLNQIPADVLLQYIVDQAGGNIRFDNHAIVVRPRYKGNSMVKADKKAE